jgi:homoserine O-succinyltransferase/O-acetyltransferase
MPLLSASRSAQERRPRAAADDPLVIGVVNNMPDAALQTTERQFRELLSAASHNSVWLRFFSLPELPRADASRAHISQHYEDISELWTSHLDGLIVTGTEPRAPVLADEPYWPTLAKLVDWAEEHTISTVWSCLAAHAAVLHIDGINRRAFREKVSGVFDCKKAAHHTIVAGTPSRWRVPHSRCNELSEEALISRGYSILSRLPGAGPDMFVKQRKSLFLFMQGHLEYDSGALLREYRRDIRRFLAGERDSYPEMPCGYFDQDTAAALAGFRRQALENRSIDLLSRFPAIAEEKLAYPWLGPAVRIYGNWLSYLAEHKSKPRLDKITTSAIVHNAILVLRQSL